MLNLSHYISSSKIHSKTSVYTCSTYHNTEKSCRDYTNATNSS